MRWFRSAGLGPLLKWGVGLCLVVMVVLAVDHRILWQELSRLPLILLLPCLVLTVFQVFVSAWRWRYTAALLNTSLPYDVAVSEYYLGSFLNQLLPGGVLGDVNRAWRHGNATGQPLVAIHGVVIERFSGQLVLGAVVVMSVVWLTHARFLSIELQWWLWFIPMLIVLVVAARLLIRSSTRLERYSRQLGGDLGRTILSWPAFPVQLGTSLAVLASYLGVFLILAHGAGYLDGWRSLAVVTALCSLLLLSMVVPLTVSGWGVREGAAALLWPMVGLPAEQGVALSVGYGAVVFVSTLPGLALLLLRLRPVRRSRDQTTCHCPD